MSNTHSMYTQDKGANSYAGQCRWHQILPFHKSSSQLKVYELTISTSRMFWLIYSDHRWLCSLQFTSIGLPFSAHISGSAIICDTVTEQSGNHFKNKARISKNIADLAFYIQSSKVFFLSNWSPVFAYLKCFFEPIWRSMCELFHKLSSSCFAIS